jgi:hypothetical protein
MEDIRRAFHEVGAWQRERFVGLITSNVESTTPQPFFPFDHAHCSVNSLRKSLKNCCTAAPRKLSKDGDSAVSLGFLEQVLRNGQPVFDHYVPRSAILSQSFSHGGFAPQEEVCPIE